MVVVWICRVLNLSCPEFVVSCRGFMLFYLTQRIYSNWISPRLFIFCRFSSLAISRSPPFALRKSIVLRSMASQLAAGCSVVRGHFESLPAKVQDYVADKVELCQPDNVYICDGSKEENEFLINELIEAGVLTKLAKYDNWYVEILPWKST